MNKIVEELKKTKVFYVATMDQDQPRVRPFAAVTEFEGKPYICSNNQKACYEQMMKNPKVEICGMEEDNTWIRVTGRLVLDERIEAKTAILADPTGPSMLYKAEDDIFVTFCIEDAVCTKYSFTADPVVIQ
ncbi:MAG: pyridoxamine 5'-phosphate oxidase family protein [Clostridiales bacterium]|nr:pyridoxamine 5'-phosphate oxidase family protein [Clostridiales bacterium]